MSLLRRGRETGEGKGKIRGWVEKEAGGKETGKLRPPNVLSLASSLGANVQQ